MNITNPFMYTQIVVYYNYKKYYNQLTLVYGVHTALTLQLVSHTVQHC